MDWNSGTHRGRNSSNPRGNHHSRQPGPSRGNFSHPRSSFASRHLNNQNSSNFNSYNRGNWQRPVQPRASVRPLDPLAEARRRTWDEQRAAVGLKRGNDDADFVWGSTKIAPPSAAQDESPLQGQLRTSRENQQLELSYATLSSQYSTNNQSSSFNQAYRRPNRLTDNQAGNMEVAQPFFQPGQLEPGPLHSLTNSLPGQNEAIEERRTVRDRLLRQPYQPSVGVRPVFEKAVVSGPHEVEPVMARKRAKKIKDGEKGKRDEVPMDVDEPVVVEDVTEGIELVEPENKENDLSDVISKIQAISLSKVSAVSGGKLVLEKTFSIEGESSKALMRVISSLSTQPLRSLFASSLIASSSNDNRTVLNYAALYHYYLQRKSRVSREYRQPLPAEVPWAMLRTVAGLPPTKLHIMTPLIGEADRVIGMDRLRGKVSRQSNAAEKAGKEGSEVARSATLRKLQASNYGPVKCAARECNVISLVGYCASRVFNMKKPGLDSAQEEHVRFCDNHAGAVFAQDMCPHCRATSVPQKRKAGEAPSSSVYCLGSQTSGQRRHVRHLNHTGCMTKVNGKTEWTCLHCGNDDVKRFVKIQNDNFDWNKKSAFLDEDEDMPSTCHKFRQSRPLTLETAPLHPVATLWRHGQTIDKTMLPPSFLPKDTSKKAPTSKVATRNPARNAKSRFMQTRARAEPTLSRTPLLRPPLFSHTVVHFKDYTITDGLCTIDKSERTTGRKSITCSQKYATALVTISAQCEGCLCGETCVPGQCPCMSWYSATRGYNVDQSLRMEDFDVQDDLLRECSQTCLCNVNSCVNRATQVPPRVQLRDGQKLVLTKDVHEGDFLFRMAGELNETKTDKPEDGTFLLPKFPIWPPGCEESSLCVKHLQGPARLIRSAKQCQEDDRPAEVNVVPVLVLCPPLGIHIGNPRQLVVPVVAFFALKSIKAGEVDLVYESDFRHVNPVVPSLMHIAKEEGTDGQPVEATGTLFMPV